MFCLCLCPQKIPKVAGSCVLSVAGSWHIRPQHITSNDVNLEVWRIFFAELSSWLRYGHLFDAKWTTGPTGHGPRSAWSGNPWSQLHSWLCHGWWVDSNLHGLGISSLQLWLPRKILELRPARLFGGGSQLHHAAAMSGSGETPIDAYPGVHWRPNVPCCCCLFRCL